nr:hypothetical protein [Boseongicola aestuarii]
MIIDFLEFIRVDLDKASTAARQIAVLDHAIYLVAEAKSVERSGQWIALGKKTGMLLKYLFRPARFCDRVKGNDLKAGGDADGNPCDDPENTSKRDGMVRYVVNHVQSECPTADESLGSVHTSHQAFTMKRRIAV